MDPKNFLLVPELHTEQKLDEQQKIIQLFKLENKLKNRWDFTNDEIKELIKQAEKVQTAIDYVWQTVPQADHKKRRRLLIKLLPKDLSHPDALPSFLTALIIYTNAQKKAMETVRHIFPDAAPDECNDIFIKFWTDDYPFNEEVQEKFEAELSLYKRERDAVSQQRQKLDTIQKHTEGVPAVVSRAEDNEFKAVLNYEDYLEDMGLTERQKQIVQLNRKRKTQKEISNILKCSPSTVKRDCLEINTKLKKYNMPKLRWNNHLPGEQISKILPTKTDPNQYQQDNEEDTDK